MRFLRRNKSEKNDAAKAVEEAQKNLEETKETGKEVSEVANALRRIRERNHFAEQLEAVIIRPRGYRT